MLIGADGVSHRYFGDFTGLLIVPDYVPEDQIQIFLKCKDITAMEKKSLQGNYTIAGNITTTEQAYEDVCAEIEETNLKVFEKKREGKKGMDLCLNLGGSLNTSSSSYEEIIEQGRKQDCSVLWFPVNYNTEEKQWKQYAYNNSLYNLMWSKNYPIKANSRGCAYLNMASGTLENDRCGVEQCHFCYFTKSTQFNLYGICKDSIIDQSYTLIVDKLTDRIHWKGFGKTNLVKNTNTKQWEIVQVHQPFAVLGRTLQDAPENEFYPLGDRTWEIFNDTCIGLNNVSEKSLFFSSCKENQFSCSDSLYI